MRQPLFFGSDHAGLPLKKPLIDHLLSRDHICHDLGTDSLQSCDYPVYAQAVCRKVLETGGMGILICGSGMGMSMAANRFAGIRAALCTNEFLARMARRHNHANVLCLGQRVIGIDLAKSIIDAFLDNSFEGGRHQHRIDMFEKHQN
ncbi:MAG: ribose 5-phosphate isomerase B [Desulfovibrionales bacterium]